MKKALPLLALTLLFSSIAFSAPTPSGIVGNWKGTLEIGQVKLRVLFKITKAADGSLTAKMDSLDQGARDFAVEAVSFKDNNLHMDVKSIQGVYDGALDKTGEKIVGQWKQGQQPLPLTLERSKGAIDLSDSETLSPEELAASKVAAQKLAGTWKGDLSTSAAEIRLVLNITKSKSGAAAGTIDSPDQGGKDIPVSAIRCADGKVRFEVRGIGGKYEGTLAGDAIKGEWQQGGQSMPLNFKKAPAAK